MASVGPGAGPLGLGQNQIRPSGGLSLQPGHRETHLSELGVGGVGDGHGIDSLGTPLL